MITIALDEQGEFEKAQSSNKAIFIAGLLYDDKGDVEDAQAERRRLEEYYERVCDTAGTTYPNDLHHMDYPNGSNNDGKVKQTKIQVKKTLADFLKKGTYEGEKITVYQNGKPVDRKGNYSIFALVKSKKGKEALRADNISMLVDEKVAGNLYIHMAEEVVSRMVFHNPVIDNMKHVQLDLPTRKGVIEDGNISAKKKEFEKLGYQEDGYSTAQKPQFQLTTADVYRTAVEREMLEREKGDIQIESISTKSIGYKYPSGKMSFLRLADSVCSILGFELKGNQPKEWIEQIEERANELTGSSDNIIFAYDNIDTYFRKAWMKIEDGDYFEALNLVYEAIHIQSEMTDFYKRVWVPLFLKKLRQSVEETGYVLSLKKLQPMILKNGLNQEKLIFIYKELEKMADVLEEKYNQQIFYELYDVGVTAYTHIGNSDKAKDYFEKCKKYAQFVGTENYLATCNKMVVFLCDYFRYEEAVSIASDNVIYMEEIQRLRNMMFEDAKYFTGLAKAYSQLGQVYAYMRDNLAEEYFCKALGGFEEGSPNYNITLSYLLHYYIDMGNETKYEIWAKEYFGGETLLEKQFNYIVHEGAKKDDAKISLKFALYVFVKSFYTFYMDKAGKKIFNKLFDLENGMKVLEKTSLRQLNGHPWELIYKYIAFIALDADKKELADKYMKKAQECLEEKGYTIEELIQFGVYQYEEKMSGISNIEKYHELEKVITYMYR